MASRLPPLSARLAIGMGFLSGTWALVLGLDHLIGHPLQRDGYPGPWAAWGTAAILLGALWMLAGNLYLFQHRRLNWAAMLALVLLSLPFAGWGVWILAAQLVLLLLPSTRRALTA